jgi:hypothetical protein
MSQRDFKNEALRAWFEITTDRIVGRMQISKRDAERYIAYFNGCKQDGDFMSRREHYAFQIAKGIAMTPFTYGLLLALLVSFIAGLYFGYKVGRMQGFW